MMSHAKQTRRLTPASRDTLLHLLETLSDALFVVDDTQTIVYANASAQAMLGTTPEDVCGKSLWRGAPHLVSTALYQAVHKAKQTREPTEVEYVSPVTTNWLHVSLSPTDEGLALFFHEYPKPPYLHDALSRNEQMYRDLLESFSDGVTIVSPDGLVLDINQRPLSDAHLRWEEAVGKLFTDLPAWSYDPAVQQQLRAAIARASRGETVRFEARIHPRTDLSLDILMTITSHRDASQQVEYLICTGRDITERKQAENELRTLVDAIPHIVWIAGPDGSVTYNNQRLLDFLTMTHEQAEGAGWMAGVHPDDRQRVGEAWRTSIQTGVPYEVEHRMQDGTSGAYRWFLVRGVPQRNAQGAILHWVGTCTDIDEQKQAEERVKESEQNWRVLAETVPQLVWTTYPDSRIDYVNQRYCDLTQANVEQLRNYGWHQVVHPEDLERTLALRQHSLETGELYENEYRLRDGRTGGYRWFLARALPVRDEAGQIVKWFGTGTDIHENKRAADDIRVLLDAIPHFVWIMRPDGSCDYCNQRWRDYTNMTSEQTQGDGWLQSIHPNDRAHTLAAWQSAVQTGMPYEVEYRVQHGRTGAYRWFLARGMSYKDDQGTILKWFGTSTDIDDRKQAEQQLKESQENLRVLAETVPQLVWMTSPDGLVEYWSQRWYDYSGSSPEQTLGHGWSQFLHPDDDQRTLTVWQHACASGKPYEIEYRLKEGQTGGYRWFLARAMPVRDETGQITKWFGTSTDIEDQKRIEEALRQSQERIRALIDSNIIGITSNEGEEEVLVEANEAFLQMTGYTQEDVRSRTLARMKTTPPGQAQLFQSALQEVAEHKQHTPIETEIVCKDGSRLPVLVGGVLFQERPRQIISFVLDNSARKELEQRKDAFISMASHELKNPLTTLKLQTSLLHKQLARKGLQASAPALSRMETQINKITRLVEELLDVSKIQAGRLEYLQETVDLDALLWEITETLQQSSPSHTLVVRGTVGTSLIGDRDRLGQVFINLVSNAIKYSPDAKTVEIDLSTSEETAVIRVHDHGLGIPREQRDKIFERFYRVTDPGQRAIPGLGMGLYIVAEIVKRHGGTITVESEVGKGSTFQVTLPTKRDA